MVWGHCQVPKKCEFFFQGIYVTSIPVSPHPLSDVMMQGPDTQIGCRPPQVLPQESALREAKLVSELLESGGPNMLDS